MSEKLVYWNQSHDFCEWNGVTCDNKAHVIALDLSEESISGGLDNSSSLFNLQFLQNLNLAYNEFDSEVPSELHRLKNLRYLNLSNAGFKGQIPNEISYLRKLVFLDLSTSLHTTKLEETNKAKFLQNLTEIKELYLDGVKMSIKGKEWGQALSLLQNLQIVSMSSCFLLGPIDSSLVKLQSLSVLRLNNNNFSSSVPETFGGLTNLTTLHLRNCNLIGMFPKQIFQISNLQVLDLSDNQNLQGSLPYFQHNVFLRSLNLSHTCFSGQLPTSIHNLRMVSSLDLSNSKFHGRLPSSISELTSLVHIDLSFNNFTGSLPFFNMSKNLSHLSISNNGLEGEVPSFYFKGLENLVFIDLGRNFLNGSVPSSPFTLPYLHGLSLSHNKFEGLLDEFPNASSSPLEFLDISGNNLQGHIPLSIFHLKKLSFIEFSSNKFNGTIHLDMFKSMQNLVTLDLSHNNLLVNGTLVSNQSHQSPFPKLSNLMLASCKLTEFPRFLRHQSNLLYLDLSSNQIQGTIPNWIWRFHSLVFLNLSNNFLTDLEGPFENISSNLFSLDLHSNQLKGPTPILPKNVFHLDYSSNKFSLIDPPEIGNHIPFATSLSLANNNFQGKIPKSLCNMSSLRMLDLSDNQFNGSIPECLIRMSSTHRVLNLAGNNLTGHISDTFSTSCALQFLDLNENFLSGNIPTLRVIILRLNRFYGSLECPNSNGKWKAPQIIDVASNNLSGALPIALLQSWKSLMMPDEDDGKSKLGQLYIDIYDNINLMDVNAGISSVNKDLASKLAKIISTESQFVINSIFFDVNAYDFGRRSYLDSVTIVNKGIQQKFVKILFTFASLDFSSNHFEGPIPEEIMNFKALLALNLSKNAFSGNIPSSVGNLKHLESLDLSMNSISGRIPLELASLNFLEVLNLSYNHLIGPIPTGTQIQSFEADSFKGNNGLCGPPLIQNCNFDDVPGLLTPTTSDESNHGNGIDWNFLSAELGFTFGLATKVDWQLYPPSSPLFIVDQLLQHHLQNHSRVPQIRVNVTEISGFEDDHVDLVRNMEITEAITRVKTTSHMQGGVQIRRRCRQITL
ncbi:receptor-like protein 32 [Neltuma alba]|uniref:receptor-like protein 32 n=1 Tax=Neltuma alba TaxID=207710 RepID=UPI0010A594D9|nr:receptor-like protein 32 [Prosopis alba]